jgi:hypothetical protein
VPLCRVAFIPFICAGDPDLETTSAALQKLDEIGSDVIELGVPYSVRDCSYVMGVLAAIRQGVLVSKRVLRYDKPRVLAANMLAVMVEKKPVHFATYPP